MWFSNKNDCRLMRLEPQCNAEPSFGQDKRNCRRLGEHVSLIGRDRLPAEIRDDILPSPQSVRDRPRRRRTSSGVVVPTAYKCDLMEHHLALGVN